MVKMIPKICSGKHSKTRFFISPPTSSSEKVPVGRWADLSRAVEQARRRALRLGVGDLDGVLEAQRQVSGHEEPADTE